MNKKLFYKKFEEAFPKQEYDLLHKKIEDLLAQNADSSWFSRYLTDSIESIEPEWIVKHSYEEIQKKAEQILLQQKFRNYCVDLIEKQSKQSVR